MAEESEFKPRAELVKEIGTLRKDNKELRDDLKQKKIVPEKYENELKRYRSEAFLEDKFDGEPYPKAKTALSEALSKEVC